MGRGVGIWRRGGVGGGGWYVIILAVEVGRSELAGVSLSWEEGLERWRVGFTEVIVSEGLREGIFDMAAFGGISWRASFRVACLAGVWRCIISEPSTDHVEIQLVCVSLMKSQRSCSSRDINFTLFY